MRPHFTYDEFSLHSHPARWVSARPDWRRKLAGGVATWSQAAAAAARAREQASTMTPGRTAHATAQRLQGLLAGLGRRAARITAQAAATVVRPILWWQQVLRLYWRKRQQFQALAELDPRTLQDLGLDRSELRSVVEELYRIPPGQRRRAPARRMHGAASAQVSNPVSVAHPPAEGFDHTPAWHDPSLRY